MNGDDGYVNGGGGGSVWWELAVSEGKLTSADKGEFTEMCPDNRFNPHRPAQANHGRYMLTGHDSFRENGRTPEEHGYFEITIHNVDDISRVELVDGKTLRLYVPVADASRNNPVTQYTVKWGLRQKMEALGGAQLRAALQRAGINTSAV